MSEVNAAKVPANLEESDIQRVLLKFALCRLTKKDLAEHLHLSEYRAKALLNGLVGMQILAVGGSPKRQSWTLTRHGAINFVKKSRRRVSEQSNFNYWTSLDSSERLAA